MAVKEWVVLVRHSSFSLSGLTLKGADSFLEKSREVSDYRSVQTE